MTQTSLEATTGNAAHPAAANGSPDPRRATVPLSVTFHTQRVGDIRRDTFLSLVMTGEKDKAVWKIDWTPEAVLPHLVAGRLVRMTRLPTSRGRIIARDGTELATFTDATVVGVVPEQIKNEAGMLASLQSILGQKADDIKAQPNAAWVLQSDRGITFATEVPRGSTIVEGDWWSADYKGPPLISFEKKIADGLGLKIGAAAAPGCHRGRAAPAAAGPQLPGRDCRAAPGIPR